MPANGIIFVIKAIGKIGRNTIVLESVSDKRVCMLFPLLYLVDIDATVCTIDNFSKITMKKYPIKIDEVVIIINIFVLLFFMYSIDTKNETIDIANIITAFERLTLLSSSVLGFVLILYISLCTVIIVYLAPGIYKYIGEPEYSVFNNSS